MKFPKETWPRLLQLLLPQLRPKPRLVPDSPVVALPEAASGRAGFTLLGACSVKSLALKGSLLEWHFWVMNYTPVEADGRRWLWSRGATALPAGNASLSLAGTAEVEGAV